MRNNSKKNYRTRLEIDMDAKTDESTGKCPVMQTTVVRSNRDWWPNQLNLQVLHQHTTLSNPMGEAFDYAKEFKSLDLNAVCVQPVSATPLVVYRLAFGSPRSFADVD
jgi:catalase (peroxidase I)